MEEHNNHHRQPLLPSISDNHEEQQQLKLEVSVIERTWVESNKFWQIAGPSIFARLCLYSLAVVTQSFVGHISDTDLAAISIATTVITYITFAFLVMINNIFLFLRTMVF
ncbi:putative multi antimicrobial extrusion protein [Helianthus anomalus]